MTLALELTIRLVGAGLLGAVIGFERELRAKGAARSFWTRRSIPKGTGT